jgi:hypothetical protein
MRQIYLRKQFGVKLKVGGRDHFISIIINLFSMKEPKDRSRVLRRVAEVKVKRVVEVKISRLAEVEMRR